MQNNGQGHEKQDDKIERMMEVMGIEDHQETD